MVMIKQWKRNQMEPGRWRPTCSSPLLQSSQAPRGPDRSLTEALFSIANEDEDCGVEKMWHQPLSAPVNPHQPAPICCRMTLNGDTTIKSLLLALPLNKVPFDNSHFFEINCFSSQRKNSRPSKYSFPWWQKNEFTK